MAEFSAEDILDEFVVQGDEELQSNMEAGNMLDSNSCEFGNDQWVQILQDKTNKDVSKKIKEQGETRYANGLVPDPSKESNTDGVTLMTPKLYELQREFILSEMLCYRDPNTSKSNLNEVFCNRTYPPVGDDVNIKNVIETLVRPKSVAKIAKDSEVQFNRRGTYVNATVKAIKKWHVYDVMYDDGEEETTLRGAEAPSDSKALAPASYLIRSSVDPLKAHPLEVDHAIEVNYRGTQRWFPGRISNYLGVLNCYDLIIDTQVNLSVNCTVSLPNLKVSSDKNEDLGKVAITGYDALLQACRDKFTKKGVKKELPMLLYYITYDVQVGSELIRVARDRVSSAAKKQHPFNKDEAVTVQFGEGKDRSKKNGKVVSYNKTTLTNGDKDEEDKTHLFKSAAEQVPDSLNVYQLQSGDVIFLEADMDSINKEKDIDEKIAKAKKNLAAGRDKIDLDLQIEADKLEKERVTEKPAENAKIQQQKYDNSMKLVKDDAKKFTLSEKLQLSKNITFKFSLASQLSYMVYWAARVLNVVDQLYVDERGYPLAVDWSLVIDCIVSLQRATNKLAKDCPFQLIEDANHISALLTKEVSGKRYNINLPVKFMTEYPNIIEKSSFEDKVSKDNLRLYTEQAQVLDMIFSHLQKLKTLKHGEKLREVIGYRVPPSGGKTMLSVAIASMLSKNFNKEKRLLYVCYNSLVRMAVTNACELSEIPYWVCSTRVKPLREGWGCSQIQTSYTCKDMSRAARNERRRQIKGDPSTKFGDIPSMWIKATKETIYYNHIIIADITSAIEILKLYGDNFIVYLDEPTAGSENGVTNTYDLRFEDREYIDDPCYYCAQEFEPRSDWRGDPQNYPFPASDEGGRCGPDEGPQCKYCEGFTRSNPPKEVLKNGTLLNRNKTAAAISHAAASRYCEYRVPEENIRVVGDNPTLDKDEKPTHRRFVGNKREMNNGIMPDKLECNYGRDGWYPCSQIVTKTGGAKTQFLKDNCNAIQDKIAELMMYLDKTSLTVLLSATLPNLHTEFPAIKDLFGEENITMVETQRLPVGCVALGPDGKNYMPHQIAETVDEFKDAIRGLRGDSLMLRFYTPGPVFEMGQEIEKIAIKRKIEIPNNLKHKVYFPNIGSISHKRIRSYAQDILSFVAESNFEYKVEGEKYTFTQEVFIKLKRLGLDNNRIEYVPVLARDFVEKYVAQEGRALAVTTSSKTTLTIRSGDVKGACSCRHCKFFINYKTALAKRGLSRWDVKELADAACLNSGWDTFLADTFASGKVSKEIAAVKDDALKKGDMFLYDAFGKASSVLMDVILRIADKPEQEGVSVVTDDLDTVCLEAIQKYVHLMPAEGPRRMMEKHKAACDEVQRQRDAIMKAGGEDAIQRAEDIPFPIFKWPVSVASFSAALSVEEINSLDPSVASMLLSGLGKYNPSSKSPNAWTENLITIREAANGHLACLFSAPDIVYGTNMALITVFIGTGYGFNATRNSLYQLIGRAGRTGKANKARILFEDFHTMKRALLPEESGQNFEAKVMNWHLEHKMACTQCGFAGHAAAVSIEKTGGGGRAGAGGGRK